MDIKKLKLIYFSPTGTTRKILESIAEGLNAESVEHIDLTLPPKTGQSVSSLSDENGLIILGTPVYGGRVPVDAVRRFKELEKGKGPAVVVVVYGNREFEDSLLELKDLAVDLGLKPVAAAAFIGEHSFSTKDLPIADGRPDNEDVRKAIDFGVKIGKKIRAMQSDDDKHDDKNDDKSYDKHGDTKDGKPDDMTDLEIPGRFPYEGGARALSVAPLTDKEACTLCGICATVCPTGAIAVTEEVETEIPLCIRCCACVKSCPVDARFWEDGTMKNITRWLNENCSIRKEPQFVGTGAL